MRRPRALTTVLLACTLAAALPARAGSPQDPDMTDPRGDHGIWYLAQTPVYKHDALDLRALWVSTAFAAETEFDAGGAPVRVRHTPTALVVTFETTAAPDGPDRLTSEFRFIYLSGTCTHVVTAAIPGSTTFPGDPSGVLLSSFCASGTVSQSAGITWAAQGTRLVVTIPFAALTGPLAAQLAPGSLLDLEGARVDAFLAIGSNRYTVDSARVSFFRPPFVIGSDVPPDVECTAQPEHPGCAMTQATA